MERLVPEALVLEAQDVARRAILLCDEIQPLYDAIEWLTRPDNVRFIPIIRATIGSDMRYLVDAVRTLRFAAAPEGVPS